MNTNVKAWNVVYRHPMTKQTIETIVYAASKKEATRKAWENNVPTHGDSFFYEIVSIEEYTITPHTVFEEICKALPKEPKAPFWSTGDLILAYDAPRANAIADLIDAMGGVGLTGYYDPAEDERSGEVDRCTGWHYVDIE